MKQDVGAGAGRLPLPAQQAKALPLPDLCGLVERTTGAGAWAIDLADRRVSWTGELLRMLELPDGMVLGADGLLPFYAPESSRAMAAAVANCVGAAVPYDQEVLIVTARGKHLRARSLGEAVRNPEGTVVRIQGVLQDLTGKKRSEQELQRLAMRLSATLDKVADPFATVDANGRFSFINFQAELLLGRTSPQLIGRAIWLELDPAGVGPLRGELQRARGSARPVEFEAFYPAIGKWVEMRAYPFDQGLALYLRDTTDRKSAKDEIEQLAFYDPLTQLPNRRLLMDRLQAELTDGDSPRSLGALMFIDLDHFKLLNDTMGHSKGDLLLQKTAFRLGGCVRASDTVARLGGDEFVVMLHNLGPDRTEATAKASMIASKILMMLSQPAELAGHVHYGTCSIGITLFDRCGRNLEDVLKQADLAMYKAKAAGRNNSCFYDPQMQVSATAKAVLTSRLRSGLANGEFMLHYQPQIDVGGRMRGVEALIRWQPPAGPLVLPGDFISQAEESGLILPMGEWVLETACAQLAAWAHRPETAGLTVAVNVSARQFRHPEFVERVLAVVSRARIPAGRLELELTESLLATDIDVAIGKMGLLKGAGVSLSIDDFGMGYSGLSYLKYMPLDQVKIDGTFVKDILTDRNDAAIAVTIIGMAHSLDLLVLAEGVETEGQRDFLARHGCDCYQGHLFSPALPIGELETFMKGRR